MKYKSNHNGYYITNCIERIMRSECAIKNDRLRFEDLAEAVLIAGKDGLAASHDHLKAVLDAAENRDRYTKK